MSSVVVIGAGMGGMATAARLSALGHSVTIYEQSATWGGKLGHVQFNEHHFDTGPSLLTLPAVYRDLFLKTGRPLEESVSLIDLEPAFRYQFSDGTVLTMPGVGIGACASAIGDTLGAEAGMQWRSFMQRAGRMWAATRKPFLESALDGPMSLLDMAWRLNDVATIAPTRTLRSLSRHFFSDPRLVTLVDRYATYSGSDPRRAPAALATIPYVEQTFGAYHVAGGLRELGRALYQRCLDLGVEFHFESSVEHVHAEDRVSGITLTTGQFRAADIVVNNADATVLYDHLLDEHGQARCSADIKRLRKAVPSLSGFVMLLALDGTTPNLEHHNIFFPDNYDAEFDAIFGTHGKPQPVQDPTIYVCNPRDSAMAPDGKESWFVLVNAPRHNPATGVDWSDPQLTIGYQTLVTNLLKKRGFDIDSRTLWRDTRTPASLANLTGAPGGSIYGTSSNSLKAAFLRPRNVTPIKGLYLVGGSAHPGGGLPLVAMSAEIVASHIGRA